MQHKIQGGQLSAREDVNKIFPGHIAVATFQAFPHSLSKLTQPSVLSQALCQNLRM